MSQSQYSPFPDARWQRLEDLAQWLKDNFPPMCIGKDQHPREASWYAAQTELAQRIARTIEGDPQAF